MRSLTITTALILLTVVLAPSVAAQEPELGLAEYLRTRHDARGLAGGPHARRPNAPPTPRLADGTPNLGSTTPSKGVWDTHQHAELTEILVDPKDGIPYQPWAKALKDYRTALDSKDDPTVFCLPRGGFREMLSPSPMEFIQQPQRKRIVMIYEGGAHIWRIVHMDGRPHPPDAYDLPTWMGHAIGRWDGDTLVVDTVGYNEGHWVDRAGSPRTHLHHVTERFTRLDYYTMEYEATIDDPGAYTRPWTIKHLIPFDAETELQEQICQETLTYDGGN